MPCLEEGNDMNCLQQRYRFLVVLVGAASLAMVRIWAADPPMPPKVSSFAPAKDLASQIDFYVGRLDEALAKKDDFDGANQSRAVKDAHTLAVISLALGMHDEEHPLKEGAVPMLQAAQALATAATAEDFDAAVKAFADYKAARGSPSTSGRSLTWQKVADLGALMKQVPVVNTNLKRGVTDERRFKKQLEESAGQSATLAAIAQAAMFDTSAVKDPVDLEQWQKYCAEMRDAAAAVNTAVRAGDQAQATAAFSRMAKNCDDCHGVFRKEKK